MNTENKTETAVESSDSGRRSCLTINFSKVFLVFIIYSVILFCPVFFVVRMVFPEKYLLISGISWLSCFAAGILSFTVTSLIQKKCGELNIGAISIGMFIRSGFPLLTVLALIPLLDNIILIRTGILTLVYYVLMFPVEVYLMIPQKTNR